MPRYNATPPVVADGYAVDPQTDSSGNLTAVGNLAHDAVDIGNPLKVGGRATTTQPAAVADGDRVNAAFSLKGALHVSMGTPILTNNGWGASVAFPEAGDGSYYPAAVMPAVFDSSSSSMDAVAGDRNGVAVQSAVSSKFWSYAAAASGIVNTTTAVTIKAAAGASVRNYLKTLTIDHDTLGGATEIAIRDGAGGTVLWRGKLQTTATEARAAITFDPPLKGTANTLLEVVTLTAVTGGVYVNATGYTGA